MTSSAAKWGFEHYSPSTLNLFANDTAMFIVEKLLKRKSPPGCAAHRGTASEHAIAHGLVNQTAALETCVEMGLKEFDRLSALSTDPNRKKEREAIPGIVATGLKKLRPYGVPTGLQKKIEFRHPDLPLPLIGFVDLDYEQHGILIDIKTQLRLAGAIKTDHARQVSLYKHATSDNYDARIAYVTDKKSEVYTLENSKAHLNSLVKIALTLERFLSLSDDPMTLAAIVAPNFDSFYWNDPLARRAGYEVWGY